MSVDLSHGWNDVARRFVEARSRVGMETVRQWAKRLPAGGAVVDVGCGSGDPVALTLIEEGLTVFGVDASPVLVEEFRRRLPDAEVVCEAAESSDLFQRRFDGAVAIGLLFLLPPDDQRKVMERVGRALDPGGSFLFTAPRHACEWRDLLTGRLSLSLGEEEYGRALEPAAMRLSSHHLDEGGNHYFEATKL